MSPYFPAVDVESLFPRLSFHWFFSVGGEADVYVPFPVGTVPPGRPPDIISFTYKSGFPVLPPET
jgi:hypothetical protein